MSGLTARYNVQETADHLFSATCWLVDEHRGVVATARTRRTYADVGSALSVARFNAEQLLEPSPQERPASDGASPHRAAAAPSPGAV